MDGTHGTRAEGVDPGSGAGRADPLPVVVVGAGLAGLCCTLHLERAGVPVRLLEASDAPGGVVRTDRVSGFRLDRGFQVLQTAYPEARCVLDYEALRLHAFHPGARIRWRGAWRRVGDPFRRPLDGLATLASGIPTAGDALRVARLRADVRGASLEALMRRPACTTADALRERGFSERMIRGFFRPFYRGVFLEPELATSSRLFEFTFRMFASGDVCLPAEGMEAIPRQLAARLRPGTLRTGIAVTAADDAGVTTREGERIGARAVVVATDADAAARLLPELAPPAWNAVTCVYFDAPAPPLRGPTLALNGDEPGPVSHLCVPSEVAPGYAPPGRALVSASCLEGAGEPDAALVERTRGQLRGWFGAPVDDWWLLGVVRVPHALPRQTPASLDPVTRPVHVGGRRFVCGGHRETSSIGGAMRAGRRAARAVREALGASSRAPRPAGAPPDRRPLPPASPTGRSVRGTIDPADRDGRPPSTGYVGGMARLPTRLHRHPAARRRLAGALVALWLLPSVAAASIEGVRFEPEVRVDQEVLRLHRAALMRYRVFFKVYVAGLYLGEGISPDRVLEDVPRRLEIAYLRGFTAEQFRKVTVSGIRQNVDPETFARLGPKIEALNRLYRPVQPGDRYALTHLPGRGTELSLNGTPLGRVPGEAFSRAVFSIWLGPEPFDEDLKRELLADA